MSASAPSVSTERFDFRSVLIGGTKLGLAVGVAVVLFLLVSRVPAPPVVRDLVRTAIVLAAGLAAALLPARWVAPVSGEGIAGAAAMGLWGTVVFSAFDIVLLRPFDAYPWTWDAVGGNSTWWYLPLWWMIGTFSAWMGGIVAAARGPGASLAGLAGASVVAAVLVAAGLGLLGVALPVGAGAGLLAAVTARALYSLARGH